MIEEGGGDLARGSLLQKGTDPKKGAFTAEQKGPDRKNNDPALDQEFS